MDGAVSMDRSHFKRQPACLAGGKRLLCPLTDLLALVLGDRCDADDPPGRWRRLSDRSSRMLDHVMGITAASLADAPTWQADTAVGHLGPEESTMPDGFSTIPDAPSEPKGSVLKQTEGDAFPVLRIKEGGTDSQDRLITRVYALRPGKYAVYLAGDVRIEYADDYAEEAAQRATVVSSVGKSRAEVTSLLVGWGPDRRRVYDCKIAMALELALEKKPDEARAMIEEAKAELIRERAAAGRLQYLFYAACWCLPLMMADRPSRRR
jgi:hypothetical protein